MLKIILIYFSGNSVVLVYDVNPEQGYSGTYHGQEWLPELPGQEQKQVIESRLTLSLPGHLGFSHPKEIHVAGQDWEMGIGGCRQTCPRVPIAEEDIHDQL